EWQMVYSPYPPYEILRNRLIDFATMQKLRRFARYWDLVGNSGNFIETTPMIWSGGKSPFQAFLDWSEWLHQKIRRTDRIALTRLAELLFEYLPSQSGHSAEAIAEGMCRDYQRGGRRDIPGFLREHVPLDVDNAGSTSKTSLPKRQARHLV